MRFFLFLAIICTPLALAVPPTQPSVLIGECEIAPRPHDTACNPQQCVSSGGWCKLETVRGVCIQYVLKPNGHGITVPAKQSWGLRKGYPTLCGGCLCRRFTPAPRIQSSPHHSQAITNGSISPEDAAMIEGEPDGGTGPRMSMEALAILAANTQLTRKQRHDIAPYAFGPTGHLYKPYLGIIDAVDASGKRILTEEKADAFMKKRKEKPLGSSSGTKNGKRVKRKDALATGPRIGHAELAYMAMDTSISREQRHVLAPYAYSPRGILYNEYLGVIDAVDLTGTKILPEKKAKTLVHNFSQERARFPPPPDTRTIQRKPAKLIPPAELEELANLAMGKGLTRKQRHERAPDAFSPKGYLYMDHLAVLNAVDHEGNRIVSEKKAKTLVGGSREYERLRLAGVITDDVHLTWEDTVTMKES